MPGFTYIPVRLGRKPGPYDEGNVPHINMSELAKRPEYTKGNGNFVHRFVNDDRAVSNLIYGYEKNLPPFDPKFKGHYHPECAEFWLIMTGQIRYPIEYRGDVVADEGDVVYVPMFTFHAPRWHGPGPSARLAMNEAMPQAKPVLLEPILSIEVVIPSEAMSRASALISARRGQILGYDTRPGWRGWDQINALVPEAEMPGLIVELRSATSGVGSFSARFDHLAELAGKPAEAVVSAQALAAVSGRDFALPDDVKKMAQPVLAHRLILKPESRLRKRTAAAVVRDLIGDAKVPITDKQKAMAEDYFE